MNEFYQKSSIKEDIHDVGVVTKAKENYLIINIYGKNYYVYARDNDYEKGDLLYIEGKSNSLHFIHLESEFDFESYLNHESIYYEIDTKKVEIKFSIPLRIKPIKDFLLDGLSSDSKEFYSMLFFNESNDVLSTSYLLGIGSLFSLNGFLLSTFLRWIEKIKKRFFNERFPYLTIIICLPLLFLSQFKIGNIRALWVYYDQNIAKKSLGKKRINAILLLFLLAINPSLFLLELFDYLFIFPFFLTFLHDALSSLPYKIKKIGNSFLSYELIILIMVIEGKLVSPFSFIILYLYTPILQGIYFVSYFLLMFPFKEIIFNPLTKGILMILDFFKEILPLYYIELPIVFTILFFIGFVLLLMYLEKKDYKKGIILSFSVFFLTIFSSTKVLNTFDSYVSFINVGQGDCALIHHQNLDILIDTGGLKNKDVACDILIPYFQKKGIKNIDMVFLSHDDFDHVGAYDSLEKNFTIKNVLLGNHFDTIKVGSLEFKNYNTFSFDGFENDNSSVIYFSFLKRSYLFTGDISSKIEHELCKLDLPKIDILKLPHHGSNSSSSEEFLTKIKPRECVISCGENNSYGHPSYNVLSRLNKLNISYHRTDKEGTIYYHEGIFSLPIFILDTKKESDYFPLFCP